MKHQIKSKANSSALSSRPFRATSAACEFNDGSLESFKWVVFSIAGSLINQGIKKPPQTERRVLLASWFFYCLIISASYGGSLVAFLAAPATSPPLDTLEQLAKSDYKVYFVEGSVQTVLFEASTDPMYREIWDNKVLQQREDDRTCPTYEDCVGMCSDDTNIAAIFDYTLNKVSAETTHSNLRGEHDIHFARAKFFISGYGFGLKRSTPYKDKVNEKILDVMAAGLFPTWMARAMNVYRAHKRARIQHEVSQGIPFQDKVITIFQ